MDEKTKSRDQWDWAVLLLLCRVLSEGFRHVLSALINVFLECLSKDVMFCIWVDIVVARGEPPASLSWLQMW